MMATHALQFLQAKASGDDRLGNQPEGVVNKAPTLPNITREISRSFPTFSCPSPGASSGHWRRGSCGPSALALGAKSSSSFARTALLQTKHEGCRFKGRGPVVGDQSLYPPHGEVLSLGLPWRRLRFVASLWPDGGRLLSDSCHRTCVGFSSNGWEGSSVGTTDEEPGSLLAGTRLSLNT